MPSFLLICINYNSEPETIDMVNSVVAQANGRDGAISVVNNSPDNGAAGRLEQLAGLPQVTLLNPGENLGYFGGAAYGLKTHLEDRPLPDWVIVSNPDIVLDDPHFLERLDALHASTRCAVIAPSIRSSLTGDDQNPFMVTRPGRSLMAFREKIARSFFVFNAYELLSHLKRGTRGVFKKSKAALGRNDSSPRTVYAPHGSFFVFSRTYFEAGGHLDYEPFLYYEENFVAETALRLSLPVIYDPRLSVVHKEHASTGFFKSRALVKIIHDARAYFLKEYYGQA